MPPDQARPGTRSVPYDKMQAMHKIIASLLTLMLCTDVSAQQGPPDVGPPAPPGEVGTAPAPARPEVAFEGLAVQIRSEDDGTRAQAALELGQLGDARGMPLLIQALGTDPEPEVRRAAVHALTLLPSAAGRQALEKAARSDTDPGVQHAAAGVLAGTPMEEPPPVPSGEPGEPPPIPEEDRRPGATRPAFNPENHPDYEANRRLRLAGILTLAIGGGAGIVAGLFGGLLTGVCNGLSSSFGSSNDCAVPEGIAIAGGITFGVALTAGLPMLIVGHRNLNEINQGQANLFPRINLAITDKYGLISTGWHF